MVEKKDVTHDVTVRYNDGGIDRFYGAKIISFKDGILEIKESNFRTVYIIINKVSWWTKEVQNDK